MYVADFREKDLVNGEGIRVNLFISGCSHKCPYCFSEKFQEKKYGEKWSSHYEERILAELKSEFCDGLTVLGGEPFDSAEELIPILQRIRIAKRDDQTIWIYSGYTFEEIMQDPFKRCALAQTDVLVDGRYIHSLNTNEKLYRGSSNQRVIDVFQSIKQGKAVKYME